ncbi:MAG: DUF2283 domain-containing protein [Chloroflexi bacterium]|nr:DUF2283 domain-containing protein [Chloroflexota bacterium]
MEEARSHSTLSAKYDKELDILYLLFTEQAQEAVAEEIGDEVFVRFDPESRKIINIEYLNFQERIEEAFGPDLIYQEGMQSERLLPWPVEVASSVMLRESSNEYDVEESSD